MPAGRPVKYKTAEELEKRIDEYFNSCWADVPVIGSYGPVMVPDPATPGEKKVLTEYKQIRPYTITGLAVFLDLTRQGLLEYSEKSEEFSDAIIRAKSKVEQFAEEQLYLCKSANGPQFNLTNNFGWKNKTEVDQTIKGEINVTVSQMSDEELDDQLSKLGIATE